MRSTLIVVLFLSVMLACDSTRREVLADSAGYGNLRERDSIAADIVDNTIVVPALDNCASWSAGDSIAFDNLRTAAISRDIGGYAVVFVRTSDQSWRGRGSQAYGQLMPFEPLQQISVNPGDSTIAFNIVALGNPSRFSVRFSCDSLWGTNSPMPGVEPQLVALARKR